MRFLHVRSVDDGKSTINGRLRTTSNEVYDDQMAAAAPAAQAELSRRRKRSLDC